MRSLGRFRYTGRETEEDHERRLSGYLVSQPKFLSYATE